MQWIESKNLMIVFLSSWPLQSKALSSDNVNPSTGQPDLKKNELFSTHEVVYVIHIFCMVVFWRVKRKKLQTNWKSIKIACGAVSASHRQLRAYSPLECVKVKVKTDNNYVDVSGSTQHEIYRWAVHIYPWIYQVIIMNFRDYCLLFLIFCSTETQKRTNGGDFFANFLEPVLIVSLITLIWGAWHFCMLSFLMLIFPWQKVHWCKYLCCLLVSCSIVDTHLLLQSYVSVLVAYLPASISLGTSTESLLIFPSPFGPLSYSPIGLQALPGLGINMRIRIWLNWP